MSMPPHDLAKPPVKEKKKPKWSPEEDALVIELQDKGMAWGDVAKHLPGRSMVACRVRYGKAISKQYEGVERPKNKLARIYESSREEMWTPIAKDMGVPWQAAEDMHWQFSKTYMARQRTGDIPFSLTAHYVYGNKNDQSSSSRNVSPQLQDGSLQDPGAPSAPTVFSNLTLSTESGLLQASPLLSSDHNPPPQYQHVPEPGLAPIQNQPPPRMAGMLPGVAELTGGVSPYSTHPATHYMESPTRTDRGLGYSSFVSYSMEPARSKRGHSPDQFTANQRRRII